MDGRLGMANQATVGNGGWGEGLLRVPVRTKLISATDNIVEVAREYRAPSSTDDIVVVSEKLWPSTKRRF